MCLPALLRWLLWSSSTKTCPPKHRLRQSWPGRLLLFSDYNITLVIYWQNSQRTFSNSSMNQVNRNLTRNYLNSRIVGIHFGVFIKIVEFLEIEYITVYFTFKVILSDILASRVFTPQQWAVTTTTTRSNHQSANQLTKAFLPSCLSDLNFNEFLIKERWLSKILRSELYMEFIVIK